MTTALVLFVGAASLLAIALVTARAVHEDFCDDEKQATR